MENRRYILRDGKRDLNLHSLFLENNKTEKPKSSFVIVLFRNMEINIKRINQLKEIVSEKQGITDLLSS